MLDPCKYKELPVPKPPRGRRAMNRLRRMFPGSNQHKVHFVYLVPSDKTPTAADAIRQAALELQAWYRWQMAGKTFTLHDPVVETCTTMYPASWYSTYDSGGDQRWWFWNNVLRELSIQLGGGFWQEFDDWVVYIDAEPAEGQGAGGTSGGYISGVCVLGARDLSALLGNDHDWTHCREIGGCGHEYGHTHGLPHPDPGTDWSRPIMGVGYSTYSDCILTEANKVQLNNNPFYELRPYSPIQKTCQFNDDPRPDPAPRPRPTPTPRPR